ASVAASPWPTPDAPPLPPLPTTGPRPLPTSTTRPGREGAVVVVIPANHDLNRTLAGRRLGRLLSRAAPRAAARPSDPAPAAARCRRQHRSDPPASGWPPTHQTS